MAPISPSRKVTRRAAGFSTVGMLVSFVLLGLLLSPLVGTIVKAQRGLLASKDRSTAVNSERHAHLMLARYIRLAGSSPTGVPISGIDPDPDGNGRFDSVRLRADFNPPDGDAADPGEDLVFLVRGDTMLVREFGTDGEEPYLVGVEALGFEYFDRDGHRLTDPGRIATRALAARVTIQSRGPGGRVRSISGDVRLRNSRG
jgi:hypothetical protein